MAEDKQNAMGETRGGAFKSGVSDPIAEPNYGYSRTGAEMPPGGKGGGNSRPPTTGPEEMTSPDTASGALGGVQRPQGVQPMPSDAWCIQKANDIYINSRDYMEFNITLGWERNLYHFRNEHG